METSVDQNLDKEGGNMQRNIIELLRPSGQRGFNYLSR
jgi:hypothetical protein